MCGHKPKRRNEQSAQNEFKLLETNECTNRFCMYVVSALVCLQNTTKARWRLRTTCKRTKHIHSCLAAPTHLRPRTHSDQPILMHYLTLVRKERDERYATCGGGAGGEGAVHRCATGRRNNEGFCRRTLTTNGNTVDAQLRVASCEQ